MVNLVRRGKTGSRSINRLIGGSVGSAANGAVATEDLGGVKRITLRLNAKAIALADAAGVVAYAGLKIFDFVESDLVILSAVADLTIGKSSAGVNATFDGDFSVGSATAAGDATLTATEANIIPSTAMPQAVAGATTAKGRLAAPVVLDGTTIPVDVYLNFLVDDTDHDVTTTPANLLVSGTVTLVVATAGDK